MPKGRQLPRWFAIRPTAWRNRLGRKAQGVVLSIHGWSDYFSDLKLATFWHSSPAYHSDCTGFLRHHGRSLRTEHELPGYVDDLATYDEELDASMEICMWLIPDCQ